MKFRNLCILLWALVVSNFAMAQNEKVERTFLWPYSLPATKETGPARVQVTGVYYFTADNAGEKKSVSLHFRDIEIKFEHPFEYKYKGKYYTYMNLNAADGLATEGFNEIDITSIVLQFPPIGGLTVTDSKRPVVWISAKSGNAVDIAKCDKSKDLRTLTIDQAGSFATDMNWNNATKLLARIERIFKKSADKEEYKMVIKDADNAFKNNSLPEAKQLYKKALVLFPNEGYPAAQLAAIEKSLQNQQLKEKQDSEKEKATSNNQQSSQNTAKGKTIPGNKSADDDFWSDKSSTKTTTNGSAGNVVPEQASHKNLPDFVRTTDGGYFQRGADGKFRQVSADEYQQAKKQVANSKTQPQKEPEQPKITPEEFGAQASKNFRDQVAQNNAIYENIDRKFDMYKQNFYHAQAIQSGKENLAGLSRLEGNYSSVQELEAEFNQKYNSIRGEVNNLEQARNSQLNNAVTSTFNGNSTEQAIGQGMQVIGSMINNAQAAKERKEAQAALKLERDRQLAAMAASKTRARIELRTKLVQSFPDGGTPLSSHKVTLPEVYVFAYVNDKATFNNEQALVSLSNVFPVQQYSDGTYPYKTTILNKLKGFAPGEITLVGYYGDKARAEEMRNAFINLAAKSELAVRPFTVKTVPGSTSTGSKGSTGDFWETGKKATTKPNDTLRAEKKKDTFWDN
jgi:hypothetical protein